MREVAESIGGFASHVGDNQEINELEGSRQTGINDSAQQAYGPEPGIWGAASGSVTAKRAPQQIVTSDFYGARDSRGEQSVLSQDVVHLQDAMASRPEAKASRKGTASQHERGH